MDKKKGRIPKKRKNRPFYERTYATGVKAQNQRFYEGTYELHNLASPAPDNSKIAQLIFFSFPRAPWSTFDAKTRRPRLASFATNREVPIRQLEQASPSLLSEDQSSRRSHDRAAP